MFAFGSLETVHGGLAGARGEDVAPSRQCGKSQFRTSLREEVHKPQGPAGVQGSMAERDPAGPMLTNLTGPRQAWGRVRPSHLSNLSLSAPVYQRLLERMKH